MRASPLALAALTLHGGCMATSMRAAAPESEVCAALSAYLEQTNAPLLKLEEIDLSSMPRGVVSPVTELFGTMGDVNREFSSEEEANTYFEQSLTGSTELKLSRAREWAESELDYIGRNAPGYDTALGDAFVAALKPSSMLDCVWPEGFETADDSSAWRITLGVAGRDVAFEPQLYRFSDVGVSPDGRRALFYYVATWSDLFGGAGASGFVVMSRGEDGWRVSGKADILYH